jgi:hypothetical protein
MMGCFHTSFRSSFNKFLSTVSADDFFSVQPTKTPDETDVAVVTGMNLHSVHC